MADNVPTPGAPAAAVETAPVDTEKVVKADPTEGMTKEEKRKFKLKIDGQEEEWDEDNVIRFAQKARHYEKQHRETVKERQAQEAKIKDFSQLYEKNRRGALEMAVGREDLRAIAIEIIKEEIEDQSDPKGAEVRKLKRERDALIEAQKKEKEKAESERSEQEAAKWRQAYDEEFTEALSNTKLRKSAVVMRRMAQLQMQNLKSGKNVPIAKIAKMVENEFLSDLREYAASLDENSISDTFGEEFEEKASKARLAKLKGQQRSQPTQKPAAETKKEGPLSVEEWHKRLQEKLRG